MDHDQSSRPFPRPDQRRIARFAIRRMLGRSFGFFGILLGTCGVDGPVQVTEKLKGVNLVAPPRPPDPESLQSVRNTGAEWVAVVPYGFCRKGEPHFYFSGNLKGERNGQWWGERPEGVVETVQMARRYGLKVMLKPHVWMQGGSHLDLSFHHEADWQLFEADYARYILDFAQLADSLNVELYCITTELDRFAQARPHFWNNLIPKIRERYRGKLTYAANWDRYRQIPFWSQLDYIGVDAYFPLSDQQTPSVRELERGWKGPLRELDQWSRAQQKPILFTEFGYRSCDYAARRPWESEETCAPNAAGQAAAYEAFQKAVWPRPWFAGGFAWKWFMTMPTTEAHRDPFSPQGKTAETVLRRSWRLAPH